MSLRYARWTRDPHVSKGGSWDRPSRPREDKAPTGRKVRWFRDLEPERQIPSTETARPPHSSWRELVTPTTLEEKAR